MSNTIPVHIALSPRPLSRVGAIRAGWLVGLAALVGLAVLATVLIGGSGADEAEAAGFEGDIDWYRVQPRSFALTVTESGDLDAAERLEI
ncbi:MAG: hypothetical protein AAF593_08565, partial [Planctomycetota bacterium]